MCSDGRYIRVAKRDKSPAWGWPLLWNCLAGWQRGAGAEMGSTVWSVALQAAGPGVLRAGWVLHPGVDPKPHVHHGLHLSCLLSRLWLRPSKTPAVCIAAPVPSPGLDSAVFVEGLESQVSQCFCRPAKPCLQSSRSSCCLRHCSFCPHSVGGGLTDGCRREADIRMVCGYVSPDQNHPQGEPLPCMQGVSSHHG